MTRTAKEIAEAHLKEIWSTPQWFFDGEGFVGWVHEHLYLYLWPDQKLKKWRGAIYTAKGALTKEVTSKKVEVLVALLRFKFIEAMSRKLYRK